MKKEIIKEKTNILIIDDDKPFSNKLNEQFAKLGLKSLQASNFDSSKKYIDAFKDNLTLVVINIDLKDNSSDELLESIKANTKAKVILLSNVDEPKKRDSYFKRGILDYHLKSNQIEHIALDIFDSISRLKYNKNETILVIDDSKVICSVIKNLLEDRNYNVKTAYTAMDGLDIVKQEDISLLILDMELPDMHGINLLEKIRDLNLLENFPVLALSGSDNPAIVRQALKKGSSDFLRKPFLYEEFLLKIELWIKSSRSQKMIKQQKKQIEYNLKSFEALVNCTIEALFIFEKNICVDSNDEAYEILGLKSKDEIFGKELFEIFSILSEEHIAYLNDDSKDYSFEAKMENNDKDILDVQIKEKNLNLDDKMLKIVAVMDVTNIKRNEKMISHQSKMASMGEMIGNIAHQWRQPLTAISVSAGGIKLNYELDMVDIDETLKELDNIIDNTQFLSQTIEDFQNFLKDNRGTTNFSIKETVDKTLSIIKGNLESSDIKLHIDYKEFIQLNAVQNELIQVLLNIINNAIDVLKTKPREIIRLIMVETFTDENYVILRIQDNAGGIPEDIIGKIFEPYFTTKHQSKGTGLGLYMTHQIIYDKMGGNILVENKNFTFEDTEYMGARFDIKIPISFKC